MPHRLTTTKEHFFKKKYHFDNHIYIPHTTPQEGKASAKEFIVLTSQFAQLKQSLQLNARNEARRIIDI